MAQHIFKAVTGWGRVTGSSAGMTAGLLDPRFMLELLMERMTGYTPRGSILLPSLSRTRAVVRSIDGLQGINLNLNATHLSVRLPTRRLPPP